MAEVSKRTHHAIVAATAFRLLRNASAQRHGKTLFAHMAVLAGTEFFTVEVFTLRGLVTFYVLFFILLESRKVHMVGITPHPDEAWMKQIVRNFTMDERGSLGNCRYLIHDRDTKFCPAFRQVIESSDAKTLVLPARSLNLNTYAERWVTDVLTARGRIRG